MAVVVVVVVVSAATDANCFVTYQTSKIPANLCLFVGLFVCLLGIHLLVWLLINKWGKVWGFGAQQRR